MFKEHIELPVAEKLDIFFFTFHSHHIEALHVVQSVRLPGATTFGTIPVLFLGLQMVCPHRIEVRKLQRIVFVSGTQNTIEQSVSAGAEALAFPSDNVPRIHSHTRY